VLPVTEAGRYSEAIAWMPASYQVNDDRQRIDEGTPTRAQCALPADAFVFCCFNQNYKIEQTLFEAWLCILGAVPRGVLWLFASNPVAEATLRETAARRGIDPTRLVFASWQSKAQHLARHRCADLFLDTHTVNAHTTASDALWAGLPLLTWPGETFAGRVAASLLHAVGLPELVMPSLESYERTAIALAHDSTRLGALRRRLEQNRARMPLFRTEAYTRHLEEAYQGMWARWGAGQSAESFAVGAREKSGDGAEIA